MSYQPEDMIAVLQRKVKEVNKYIHTHTQRIVATSKQAKLEIIMVHGYTEWWIILLSHMHVGRSSI